MVITFCGHSLFTKTDDYEQKMLAFFERVAGDDPVDFYLGGYGDFDDLCYQIVTKIAQEQPQLSIKRIYCVAQERFLRKKVRFFRREDYEEVVYLQPAFEGWYKSIYFRNLAMIGDSAYVIFYAEAREDSGAYKAYTYAKKQKNKQIVNLFD